MTDTSPWLVVGLGNPGPEYAATRHNVGAMALDVLADRLGRRLALHRRSRSDVAEGHLAGHRVVLARPRSYMNESGGPVAALLSFYKVPIEALVVLHDELDIAFGTLRLKLGGGDNGHNGLKSIRRSVGSGEFYRVRIGIGRPPGRQDPADFVLRPFGATERAEAPLLVATAADAVEALLQDGLDRTQSRFNT
ncbi:MAG: aminoacyl-tRNA hydrolase [Candidatus Nanopelagicales bacterium]